MKKIALVFGTRPEAIKLAPLCLELNKRSGNFEPRIWLTAQHREMLDQPMRIFGLSADRDFNIMQPGQSLTDVTAGVLRAMETALAEERPDCIVVQGDTTTVFAAALAAYYQRIPVAHVEAGLRTNDKFSPYPEEMNRRLTAPLADFHFAPTDRARAALLAENIPGDRVWTVGNTVIDALLLVAARVRQHPPALPADFPAVILDGKRRFVLITAHRRESFGPGFDSICQAIAELGRRYPGVDFLYPAHFNPNVREPVFRILQGKPNVQLIDPLDYEAFVWAMDRCHFLLTDSGGVQEEGPSLGKPVLVMRETTERPEGVEAGVARLVGTDREVIIAEAERLLDDPAAYRRMSQAQNPYGDGRAAARIADILEQNLKNG